MLEGTPTLHLPRLGQLFTCCFSRQGITAISHDRIDSVYLSSLTIPTIGLATHDDVVCRCAFPSCERRRFFAGWNSDGCYDGKVKEHSSCGVL